MDKISVVYSHYKILYSKKKKLLLTSRSNMNHSVQFNQFSCSVMSVRPHRQQPARLPRPWDSLGKNTGMGFHFLLQFMKVKSQSEVA